MEVPTIGSAPTPAGGTTINVNRNTFNDGLLPATDRITVNTDLTAFTTFYATGNWMIEAGGTTNFAPADPRFHDDP